MAIIERCTETNNIVVRPIYIALLTAMIAIFGALMSVSVAWGRISTVVQSVETKVDKSVFDVYVQDTKSQISRIDVRQQRLEDKIDKVLEVLSQHRPEERK